ncbi:MAG: four helix bundle protein [Vicinamibacterales bacterium]
MIFVSRFISSREPSCRHPNDTNSRRKMRRAAYSVAANIAEGFASDSPAVRLRYSRIAVASLAELGYGLHVAERLGYLAKDVTDSMNGRVSQVAAPLHGLI